MERDDEITIEGESEDHSIRSDSENESDSGTAADLTIPGSTERASDSATALAPTLDTSTSGSSTSIASRISAPDPFPTVYDIGIIIPAGKPVSQISSTLSSLSNYEKYSYIFNHAKPPDIVPSRFFHGCNRRFNVDWLNKYSWLKYSTVLDGVFCAPCAILLTNHQHKAAFVNQSFSNWSKLSEKLSNHSSLAYHREALSLADTLKTSVENPSSRIDVMTSSVIQCRMEENKQILMQIVRAILFLGKQGLPFCGTIESVETSQNPGNFLSLLKVFAEENSILHSHLHHPRLRNATYISPTSQNEIINIIGHDIIRERILADVKDARYFSVLADEVSCHNVEYMPLCLRFVDGKSHIREEFISFIKLERVRAKDITAAIITTIEGLGLSVDNLRGQGYDGASTMSGKNAGVQALIRQKQPKALYTHCAGHSLNFVIATSCGVPIIRNCIDSVKAMTLWVKASPKIEGLLRAIYQKGVQEGIASSCAPLLNVCITCWVENIDGWERFTLCHPFLVHMCEVILYGDDNFETYNDGWIADDKRKA